MIYRTVIEREVYAFICFVDILERFVMADYQMEETH